MKIRKDQSGFTLIELMVVITILALLVVLVAPRLVGRTDEARRTAAKMQIKNLEQALEFFKLDNGFYPTTEQGLEALVTKPSLGRISQNWREGGYLKPPKLPLDPWQRPYVYMSPGLHGEYDLLSYGADGESGGERDNADVEAWRME